MVDSIVVAAFVPAGNERVCLPARRCGQVLQTVHGRYCVTVVALTDLNGIVLIVLCSDASALELVAVNLECLF